MDSREVARCQAEFDARRGREMAHYVEAQAEGAAIRKDAELTDFFRRVLQDGCDQAPDFAASWRLNVSALAAICTAAAQQMR